ncbi:hypothetical protein KJ819_00815, partial [Patescibacteria group bacterium]|nr:hypothetical protein [Patescibacteria group bacterium]MBU1500697.1 hypothetical protein [Patescibacteria group bacterium]
MNNAIDRMILNAYLEVRRFLMGAERLAQIRAGPGYAWVNVTSLDGESVSRYYPPLSRREEKGEETKFREKLSRSQTIPQKEVAERNKWVESWKALSPRHKRKHRAFYADLALIGAAPQTPPEVLPAEESPTLPETT